MTEPADVFAAPAALATTPDAASRDAASLRLVGWLFASWALLLVVGAVSLRQTDALAAGNRVAVGRAIFTSVNASAAAGFAQQFARPEDFSPAVRAVFVLQTLAGTLLFLAGGGVLLARLLGRPHTDGRITATALTMIAVAAAVGATGGQADDTVVGGALRGVAALACGGVVFGGDPRPGTAGFALGLVPLGVVGSWGTVVVCDGVDAVRRRTKAARRPDARSAAPPPPSPPPSPLPSPPPSRHTVRVLVLTAVVYLCGTAALFALLRVPHAPPGASLVRADALLWSARHSGVPVDFASAWPAGVLPAALAVMAVGTGAAGTAGAMGLGWLVTLPRRLRRTVGVGLILQGMLVSGTLLALAAVTPQLKTEPRVLLAFSAAFGLGLSHEPLTLTGAGLLALAVGALAAKLLPLGLLAFALRDRRGAIPATED